jgi:hypothetical protein
MLVLTESLEKAAAEAVAEVVKDAHFAMTVPETVAVAEAEEAPQVAEVPVDSVAAPLTASLLGPMGLVLNLLTLS